VLYLYNNSCRYNRIRVIGKGMKYTKESRNSVGSSIAVVAVAVA
jgi:hypothetical protein